MARKCFFLNLLSVLVFGLFFPGTSSSEQLMKQGGPPMNTYVIFFSFTQQGMQNIKDSPKRVQDAKEVVKSMGGEVKDFYGILGSKYDTMFIVQAANDEALAGMVLAIARKGSVSTNSHRLFTEAEYNKVIGSLP
jgi:uncharacterized protein with GYD domain